MIEQGYECNDRGMPRPKTGETPTRNVKIGDEWDSLGEAIGERNRAKGIRAGIAWYLTVHRLWAHYKTACAEDGLNPEQDLRQHVETRVRDWHRRHAEAPPAE